MSTRIPQGAHWALTVTILLVGTACGTVEYRINEFSELAVEYDSGRRVSLSAYGTWRPVADSERIEESGSPYTFDLRISGRPLTDAQVVHVRVVDPHTGSSYDVEGWEKAVLDRPNGAMVIVNRRGTQLPTDTVQVEVALVIGLGEERDTLEFSGALNYNYLVERRLRLLENLRGI